MEEVGKNKKKQENSISLYYYCTIKKTKEVTSPGHWPLIISRNLFLSLLSYCIDRDRTAPTKSAFSDLAFPFCGVFPILPVLG